MREEWPAAAAAEGASSRPISRRPKIAPSFLPLILNEISLPRTTTPSLPCRRRELCDRPRSENDHGQKRWLDGWKGEGATAIGGESHHEREREHACLSPSPSLPMCVKAVNCCLGGVGHNGFCRHNLFTALCRAMREERRGKKRTR